LTRIVQDFLNDLLKTVSNISLGFLFNDAVSIEDGGDGLQIWRVAANMLNKQSRTAENGWSSSYGRLGLGLTTLRRKRKVFYEMLQRASDLDG
jgi:hypothetical protein